MTSQARQLADKAVVPTGRKNLIINGAMVIDQRNSGSAVTGSGAVAKMAADRYSLYANTSATITAQQVSDAPDGFEKSNKFTCTTAASSDVSGSRLQVVQGIEGYNTAHLQFGSSNAKTITLSFWVKASNAGTYGGSFTNGAVNRAYPYSYTISSANTWEYKTVTIAGDTSGTWATDNTSGMYIFWGLGVGSDFEGTANQWNGAFDIAPPSSFSLKDNLNATWQITGVQLEVGTVATEFEHRSYGEELALCKRYYQLVASYNVSGKPQLRWQGNICNIFSTTRAFINFPFDVEFRNSPTVTVNNPGFNIAWNNSTRTLANQPSNIYPDLLSVGIDLNNGGTNFVVGYGAHVDIHAGCYIEADAEL